MPVPVPPSNKSEDNIKRLEAQLNDLSQRTPDTKAHDDAISELKDRLNQGKKPDKGARQRRPVSYWSASIVPTRRAEATFAMTSSHLPISA